MIYLDANATTPLLPEALDAMLPWLREGYANPSGAYQAAKQARRAIELARGQVADLLGARPEEILFTSGGTESVNTALRSLDALAGEGAAVVSAIEHSAVLRCVERLGRKAKIVAVNAGGCLDVSDFTGCLKEAAFVSVMVANNETGIIQPVAEIAALARDGGVPVHTDAVQAVGKIRLDVKELGVDMLSLSAHKFHGPKGIGALYVRSGLRFEPWLLGGNQESGRRSGTENTAAIVGMGAAAEYARLSLASAAQVQTSQLRDAFEAKILAEIKGITVNGDVNKRLPNTSHLSFDQCDAAGLLILLDEAGVACSAGSACMTGKQKPSHVQIAMGIPESQAKTSLRISFSRTNTMQEVVDAAEIFRKVVEKLRRVQGAGTGVGPVVVYSA